MSPLAPVLAAMLAQQPAAPPVQRPSTAPAPTTIRPTAPAPTTAPATTGAVTTPAPGTTAPTPATAPPPATSSVSPAPMPGTAPAPTTAPAPPPATLPAGIGPAIDATPPVPQDMSATPATPATATPAPAGPPFYSEADMQALRKRYGLEVAPPVSERKPVFRCWVADPTCGFVVELNATSAYAYRVRQGSVNMAGDINRWNSARVQYDVWFSIPTMVETRGKFRYTRLSLGPKGGVVASDTRDIWGNVGLAGRYWFGRGKFAPNIEFTSALVFKVAGINRAGNFDSVRGPLGFTADVGFGLGGFGALVVGGQFDSPLAGENVSDVERVSAGGMFFVGFRGNIVWGAPAALAVGTHAIANRRVTAP